MQDLDDDTETQERIDDDRLRWLLDNSACCGGHGEQIIRDLLGCRKAISDANRQATALVTALRDTANYANRNPHEGFPGVGDLDNLTDQAEALASLLEALA